MDGLLLMGHGSRDADGVAGVLELAGAVRRAAGPWLVEVGVLEFACADLSSIEQAMDRCVRAGARRIAGVPLLLHDAGHNRADMPAEVERARVCHPGLDLRLAAPLGDSMACLTATADRIRDADALAGRSDPSQTAVLLVGRGTTTPEANADFFKVGRLLWERLSYGLVECCFVSLTGPGVPAGIERCARLGARRTIVVPYFLHTGVLVKRMAQQADDARSTHAGMEICVGETLGTHPSVIELILDRARNMLEERDPSAAVVLS
jgi:sirohydrochlorin cobaltochelatase